MSNFSKYFDHTILSAFATTEDVKRVCDEAIKYDFASVAVNSGTTKICAEFLKGSGVKTTSTVGFPLGITTIECKVFETLECIKNGAGEIDYVVNVGKVKEHDYAYIKDEMARITAACKENGADCKVILETCYLTDEEKTELCKIAREVKIDFVKTSTGFGTGGATVEDIRLMRATVGDEVKVKASGGVRDLDTCMAMIEAGADRVGCSASVKILEAYNNK